MTAASAMAEYPERLYSIFVDEGDNAIDGISKKGIYAVNMHALMVPITVVIDEKLPMRKSNPTKALFAKIGEDKSLWGPLLEKAFSKYHGTYEAIVGGWPDVALNTLAGAPGISIDHGNPGDLWDKLANLDERDMMQAGCWNPW